MEAAKTFLGTDKAKKAAEWAAEVKSQKIGTSNSLSENLTANLTIHHQTGSSEYTGVNPNNNKWQSRLQVSRGSDNI